MLTEDRIKRLISRGAYAEALREAERQGYFCVSVWEDENGIDQEAAEPSAYWAAYEVLEREDQIEPNGDKLLHIEIRRPTSADRGWIVVWSRSEEIRRRRALHHF